MLGEKIGEETGMITTQRVLPGPSARVETSFRSSGTMLGVGSMTLGTYEGVMRPDGTILGEGQGVIMSKDGGHGTWKAQGVGTLKPDGSISWRGSLLYTTEYSKWARLNSCAVVFEYETSADGKTSAKVFEWK